MPVNGSVSEDSVDRTEDPAEDDLDDDERAPSRPAGAAAIRRRRRLPIAIMVVITVAVVAVAAVLVSSGSSKPQAKPKSTTTTQPINASFTTFNDQAAGFSVSYPPSWTPIKSTDPDVPLQLTFGAEGLDTLKVRVVSLSTSVNTSSVADMKAFTDSIISGNNITVLKQEGFTVGNVTGYYYFYSLPKDPNTGVTLVHSHFFVFPPHQMVSLTFQTLDRDFANLADTFDQVVSSLRVTGKP
jgi:hypothetical protein